MINCDNCNREFKSKSGLSRHIKSCVIEDDLTVVEDVKVVQVTNELSDDIKRQIDKLISAKNSCYDAKAKKDFENQIVELGGKLR